MVEVLLCPVQSAAANYAFDVTPARLVTGLITERGLCVCWSVCVPHGPYVRCWVFACESRVQARAQLVHPGVFIDFRARGRKTAMSTRSAPSLRRQQPDSPATCDNLPCREHAPCMLACSREAPEAVRFPGRRVRGARGGGTGAFSGEEDLAEMSSLGGLKHGRPREARMRQKNPLSPSSKPQSPHRRPHPGPGSEAESSSRQGCTAASCSVLVFLPGGVFITNGKKQKARPNGVNRKGR